MKPKLNNGIPAQEAENQHRAEKAAAKEAKRAGKEGQQPEAEKPKGQPEAKPDYGSST